MIKYQLNHFVSRSIERTPTSIDSKMHHFFYTSDMFQTVIGPIELSFEPLYCRFNRTNHVAKHFFTFEKPWNLNFLPPTMPLPCYNNLKQHLYHQTQTPSFGTTSTQPLLNHNHKTLSKHNIITTTSIKYPNPEAHHY